VALIVVGVMVGTIGGLAPGLGREQWPWVLPGRTLWVRGSQLDALPFPHRFQAPKQQNSETDTQFQW